LFSREQITASRKLRAWQRNVASATCRKYYKGAELCRHKDRVMEYTIIAQNVELRVTTPNMFLPFSPSTGNSIENNPDTRQP
jgi:hypothetical protein